MPKIKENKKSFEIFINALSVGYHIGKISETDPDFMKDLQSWEKFVSWMERHNIKKK